MHNDKFTISTAGLPEIPKGKSETQELLKQGYRLFMIAGKWYVERVRTGEQCQNSRTNDINVVNKFDKDTFVVILYKKDKYANRFS